MTYRSRPRRPQPSPEDCGRCGLPVDAHATTAGAAACAIARALQQLCADGWNLPRPPRKDTPTREHR